MGEISITELDKKIIEKHQILWEDILEICKTEQIKDMEELPGVMFIVDPKKERIGILEARKLGIPVIGLIDTNCNPEDVDYAIPGNDDAIRAVKLIADCMANAVVEGRQGESMEMVSEEMPESEEAPVSMEEVVAAEEATVEE